ncbi:hypothetical protein [Vulcanisaeta distributa]|uniref:hypothetical protein n=1 Tax=Vulcanisaeta distributa TaxID=164451 RepID=UPI0006D176C0|nr:hypothetical protein [Vulcanisaeta distributa]
MDCQEVLGPYNRKIWKRDLREIDVDWVYTPGRLPIPDWRDVVKSAMGIAIVGYREQAVFYYPSIGGIQTLYSSALREVQSLGIGLSSATPLRALRRLGGMSGL